MGCSERLGEMDEQKDEIQKDGNAKGKISLLAKAGNGVREGGRPVLVLFLPNNLSVFHCPMAMVSRGVGVSGVK